MYVIWMPPLGSSAGAKFRIYLNSTRLDTISTSGASMATQKNEYLATLTTGDLTVTLEQIGNAGDKGIIIGGIYLQQLILKTR